MPAGQGGAASFRRPPPPSSSSRLASSDRRETPGIDSTPPTPEPTRDPDRALEEPTTMMASMPAGVATGSGGTPAAADPLSSLRQRLADERREPPILPLGVQRNSARTTPGPPVRIEF
jgi:hypothetical protein